MKQCQGTSQGLQFGQYGNRETSSSLDHMSRLTYKIDKWHSQQAKQHAKTLSQNFLEAGIVAFILEHCIMAFKRFSPTQQYFTPFHAH